MTSLHQSDWLGEMMNLTWQSAHPIAPHFLLRARLKMWLEPEPVQRHEIMSIIQTDDAQLHSLQLRQDCCGIEHSSSAQSFFDKNGWSNSHRIRTFQSGTPIPLDERHHNFWMRVTVLSILNEEPSKKLL